MRWEGEWGVLEVEAGLWLYWRILMGLESRLVGTMVWKGRKTVIVDWVLVFEEWKKVVVLVLLENADAGNC